MIDHADLIGKIEACTDTDMLRSWIENARRKNASEIEKAAFERLISLVPGESPGTIDHDFWTTIQAFEFVLSQERGRTVRLSRTRQKVKRVGILQTLTDWASSKDKTDGFDMLIERELPHLTGEAVVLRHSNLFDASVVDAAKMRLDASARPDQIARPDQNQAAAFASIAALSTTGWAGAPDQSVCGGMCSPFITSVNGPRRA